MENNENAHIANSKKTIVVNFFAGPCAGKTTCAWEVASELKKRGIETEYVSEYAKELFWDEKFDLLDGSLKNQKFIHDEQSKRINRLLGKVQIVVTDCPTILTVMYLKESDSAIKDEFIKYTLNEFNSHNNFNLFVNRGKEFQQAGRIHDLEQSKSIDKQVKTFLEDNNIYYGSYYHKTINILVDNIIKTYNRINKENSPQMTLMDLVKIKGGIDTYDIKYDITVCCEEPYQVGGYGDEFTKYVYDNVEVTDAKNNICDWTKFVNDNKAALKEFSNRNWRGGIPDDNDNFEYEWIKEIHLYLAGYVSNSEYKELFMLLKAYKDGSGDSNQQNNAYKGGRN